MRITRMKRRPSSPVAVPVAPGLLLDSRRALVHTEQHWLAVADLHFGYEARRRREGALMPDWGMAQGEQALHDLLTDHQPQRLILVGDVMDGAGAVAETLALLERLRARVEVVCVEGNHDRAGLRRAGQFLPHWQEGAFWFEHGHLPLNPAPGRFVITGHEHPAVRLADGAGLRLKLPALVQEQLTSECERWILPAFSPWAAGGEYSSPCPRLATWLCAPHRVWPIDRSAAQEAA